MMITLKITLKMTNIEDACNLLDPQLPGLTPEHVAMVAATGLLMLFAFSYLTSESSRPIRQSRCLLDFYMKLSFTENIQDFTKLTSFHGVEKKSKF